MILRLKLSRRFMTSLLFAEVRNSALKEHFGATHLPTKYTHTLLQIISLREENAVKEITSCGNETLQLAVVSEQCSSSIFTAFGPWSSSESIWLPSLTYHSLTHGTEPLFRSCQLCSHSRTSQHFMEPEGSLPPSQEPSTGPYPEPDRANPHHPILSL
jgi:hypothetical protein